MVEKQTAHAPEWSLEREPSLDRVKSFLAKKVLPDLERGRPEFDAPHTQAVVNKMEAILNSDPTLDKHIINFFCPRLLFWTS